MRASRGALAFVLASLLCCLSILCRPSLAAAQQSDQAVAEQILGPRWKQLSRHAGMIFAGTVLAVPPQSAATQAIADTAAPVRLAPGPTPVIQLSFRVDEAIAGVDSGQVLTIHEWAGAWSMHRPMSAGQHVLIFLYPPSRLGLTSPVGGSLGQIALDQTGKSVARDALRSAAATVLQTASSLQQRAAAQSETVTVRQLERAVRGARSERERE